jgi:hypothetical protein
MSDRLGEVSGLGAVCHECLLLPVELRLRQDDLVA